MNFTVHGRTEPIVFISSVENFVKSNFQCLDSVQNIYTNYEIRVPVASDFILLIRFLYDQDFFCRPFSNGLSSRETFMKIHVQYWIEFLCKDIDGFGVDNIEYFFLKKHYRGRDLDAFISIKSGFQEIIKNDDANKS